jgi:hypothetical protein
MTFWMVYGLHQRAPVHRHKGEQREIEEQRREYILAVQPDGTVVMTCWIPAKFTQSGKLLEGNHWSGFNVGSDPIAWAPWPVYEMHERPSINDKPCLKAVPQDAPSPAGTGSELLAGREGRHEGEAASADLPTNLITHKHIFLDDCGSGA